jgi:hypothetical protein
MATARPPTTRGGKDEQDGKNEQEGKDEQEGKNEQEGKDEQDGNDKAEQVTGADAAKAKRSALDAVPGGKVTEIHKEAQDDPAGKGDKPEPGDQPDPSYESRIAYDVEVAKTDGSQVDVHLDKAFHVLGTTTDDHQQVQDD